ncbi:hypothetical protein [Acidovorax sp. 69]|uniref:hypothetical protein n=1 Tax=Acidovorax sp. 69 TaxID=2035202 RepID=UPI0012FE09A9|nr:hypothetical protein [Acidovorax sp. 69]
MTPSAGTLTFSEAGVVAEVLGAQGGYRVPKARGFLSMALTSVQRVGCTVRSACAPISGSAARHHLAR